MDSADAPRLGNTSIDIVTSLTKGTVGAVPFVGSLIAEVVGNVIPNQRVDRITRFVQLLEERLAQIEHEVLKSRLTVAPAVDMLEDAFIQAARATSDERLEHIANVVANGIAAEELNQVETKRMLWLLGQINDIEVILLRGRLPKTQGEAHADADYREKHAVVLQPRMPHLGSPPGEIEEAALYDSYKQHLVDLGLLRPNFKRPGRNELPEFDHKTGMMKASGHDVTTLGRMLLRYLSILPAWYQR